MPGMLQSPTRMDLEPLVRMLKIEAHGDPYKGLIKPKIRLIGRWLEKAGFTPGHRVQVTCVAHGVIELRSPGPSTVQESNQAASEQVDAPLY